MTLTSFWFLLFFVALLLLRRLVRGGGELCLLLGASLAFYMTWSVPCVLLVLFTSVMDFYLGRVISKTADAAGRRRLLQASLVANLGLLGFFKYANFFLDNARGLINLCGGHLGPVAVNVVIPPGISYYTFGSLSYVLDVYYERCAPAGQLRDYTLFVSFFPKILSGPIVRGADFLSQLEPRLRASWEEIESGLAQFLVGAVKKMVLADQMAGNVNQIFAAPGRFDRATLIQGLLGYTVQLYCDFSGYSDMAIGAARVLGFRFGENFQFPFSSVSITEFWRRWHISMSFWFRDYLFLPLEIATRENPRPLLRVSTNLMITMLLVGLWHGPSWNYVIYGGVHGLALVAHRAWTAWKPPLAWFKQPGAAFLGVVTSHVLTLAVVVLSLVFFRTGSLAEAAGYFKRMAFGGPGGEHLLSVYIYPVVAVVFLAHLLINKDRNLPLEWPQKPAWVRICIYTSLLTVLACLAATEAAPFIYFKY
jgi:alginate O-acetyltransferase complex protein AlgI